MNAPKLICLDCHSEDTPRPRGLPAALLLLAYAAATLAAHFAHSQLVAPLLLATLIHISLSNLLDPRRPACRHCASRRLIPRGTPHASALRASPRHPDQR